MIIIERRYVCMYAHEHCVTICRPTETFFSEANTMYHLRLNWVPKILRKISWSISCIYYYRQKKIQKPTSEPPDVTPESYYATVVKNPEFDDTAIDISQIPPPTVYDDLNIVAISQSPDEKEQSRRSLV